MVLSADSPARAIVRNCKQFNGQHGCDWCECPGETMNNMVVLQHGITNTEDPLR